MGRVFGSRPAHWLPSKWPLQALGGEHWRSAPSPPRVLGSERWRLSKSRLRARGSERRGPSPSIPWQLQGEHQLPSTSLLRASRRKRPKPSSRPPRRRELPPSEGWPQPAPGERPRGRLGRTLGTRVPAGMPTSPSTTAPQVARTPAVRNFSNSPCGADASSES